MGKGIVLSVAWGAFSAIVIGPVFHMSFTQTMLTSVMGCLIISYTVTNATKH